MLCQKDSTFTLQLMFLSKCGVYLVVIAIRRNDVEVCGVKDLVLVGMAREVGVKIALGAKPQKSLDHLGVVGARTISYGIFRTCPATD